MTSTTKSPSWNSGERLLPVTLMILSIFCCALENMERRSTLIIFGICENHGNLCNPRAVLPTCIKKFLQIGVNHFQRWSVGSIGFLGADALDGPEDLGEFVDGFNKSDAGFAVSGLAGFGAQFHDLVN